MKFNARARLKAMEEEVTERRYWERMAHNQGRELAQLRVSLTMREDTLHLANNTIEAMKKLVPCTVCPHCGATINRL